MRTISLADADPSIVELAKASLEARNFSYSPYSNFPVGAAARTTDGVIYKGCNVENSLYSAAICAERTAFVKAVSDGHKKFEAVAVCAVLRDEFVSPCGLCRQFIVEFGQNIQIYLVKPDLKEVLITDVKEILPLSFNLKD